MKPLHNLKYEKETAIMIWLSLISMVLNVALAFLALLIKDVSDIYALYHIIIAVFNFLTLRFIWVMIDIEAFDIPQKN